MSRDQLHLLSFSPCGGTAEVSRALARDGDADIILHDRTTPAARKAPLAFGPEDRVFIAFPVYGGGMPRNSDEVFRHIEGNGARCALVAVYGNREYEGALLDLFAAAVKKGFRPAAAVAAVAQHSLAPQVAAGRPDAEDREKLAAFGRHILEAMREGAVLATAPGAYPEWKLPKGASLFPLADREKCVACGQCVSVCPAGAIPPDDPAATHEEKCIVCAACAKYCPTGARQMGSPESRGKLAHHLVTAMSRRREPELWLGEAAKQPEPRGRVRKPASSPFQNARLRPRRTGKPPGGPGLPGPCYPYGTLRPKIVAPPAPDEPGAAAPPRAAPTQWRCAWPA